MTDAATVARQGTSVTPKELAALRAWRRYGGVPAAARALGRSEHTVREQLRNVRSRLGVHRTADAAHELLD